MCYFFELYHKIHRKTPLIYIYFDEHLNLQILTFWDICTFLIGKIYSNLFLQ